MWMALWSWWKDNGLYLKTICGGCFKSFIPVKPQANHFNFLGPKGFTSKME